MDYKNLLLKYMWYIGENEGTDFTNRSLDLDNSFNSEEKKELRELSTSWRALSHERSHKAKFARQK